MSQYRVPRETSKYYIPKEEYLTVVHYCLQYPTWEAELKADPDSGIGIDTAKERVQTSNQFDPVSSLAIRRAAIAKKKKLIDDTATEVAGSMGLNEWLILGVCHGLTYYQLRQRGIHCGKKLYYKLRQMFYYELSKKL